MRTRLVVPLAAAALVVGAPACVSLMRTPEARFFVLRSLVEPPSLAQARSPVILVGVLPVSLPGYIDRPQVVTWAAPGELRIDEFVRWGEPLDEGVTRTLMENLGALLPEGQVIRTPYSSTVVPRCRVKMELSLFGPQAGGLVRLEGRWALLPPRDLRPYVVRAASLQRGPFAATGGGAPDTAAGVEAMSELVAELAKEIAAAVQALPAESGSASR